MGRYLVGRAGQQLAGCLWGAAALLYLGSELAAALAFSPRYSYAENYISDLGVTSCGTIFDGRAICSPLHPLMNGNFIVQGLLFPGAAIVLSRSLSSSAAIVLLAVAALNGIGNVLLGLYTEAAPGQFADALSYHGLGALLAIACGNGTVLLSASIFRTLALPRIHRRASLVLPLLGGVSLLTLIAARGAATTVLVPDAVWERISVYPIPAWELLTAACLMAGTRGGRT